MVFPNQYTKTEINNCLNSPYVYSGNDVYAYPPSYHATVNVSPQPETPICITTIIVSIDINSCNIGRRKRAISNNDLDVDEGSTLRVGVRKTGFNTVPVHASIIPCDGTTRSDYDQIVTFSPVPPSSVTNTCVVQCVDIDIPEDNVRQGDRILCLQLRIIGNTEFAGK
ncbi:uncharacterized protein [Amphiura filiformis]|uniref:uncharacterized protein isoform X2 n=1 Tax=Amphiura filiformis TaxID=82378 RepID=UPI003B217BD7